MNGQIQPYAAGRPCLKKGPSKSSTLREGVSKVLICYPRSKDERQRHSNTREGSQGASRTARLLRSGPGPESVRQGMTQPGQPRDCGRQGRAGRGRTGLLAISTLWGWRSGAWPASLETRSLHRKSRANPSTGGRGSSGSSGAPWACLTQHRCPIWGVAS